MVPAFQCAREFMDQHERRRAGAFAARHAIMKAEAIGLQPSLASSQAVLCCLPRSSPCQRTTFQPGFLERVADLAFIGREKLLGLLWTEEVAVELVFVEVFFPCPWSSSSLRTGPRNRRPLPPTSPARSNDAAHLYGTFGISRPGLLQRRHVRKPGSRRSLTCAIGTRSLPARTCSRASLGSTIIMLDMAAEQRRDALAAGRERDERPARAGRLLRSCRTIFSRDVIEPPDLLSSPGFAFAAAMNSPIDLDRRIGPHHDQRRLHHEPRDRAHVLEPVGRRLPAPAGR